MSRLGRKRSSWEWAALVLFQGMVVTWAVALVRQAERPGLVLFLFLIFPVLLFASACAVRRLPRTGRYAVKQMLARVLFRCRFPRCGIFSGCDFRPHFDGSLYNAGVLILPRATAEDTRQLASHRFRQMCRWLHRIRWCFAAGDRIQLHVGFPLAVRSSGRGIFKGWIPANRLQEIAVDFDLDDCERLGGDSAEIEGWERGILDASDA